MTYAETVEKKLEIFAKNILKPKGLETEEFRDIVALVRLMQHEGDSNV